MIKYIRAFIILTFCFFLFSCADDAIIEPEDTPSAKFKFTNSTSSSPHNFLCSDGQTLSFSLGANSQFESIDVDEGRWKQIEFDIKEGDIINIQVREESGTLILSREKTFSPSNPEMASNDGRPSISVCDTRVLRIAGF